MSRLVLGKGKPQGRSTPEAMEARARVQLCATADKSMCVYYACLMKRSFPVAMVSIQKLLSSILLK